jgi:hypothetical protein
VAPVYPLPLRGLHLLLAVHDFTSLKGGELVCQDNAGAEQFRMHLGTERLTMEEIPPPPGSATEFRVDPLGVVFMLDISPYFR